MTLSKGLQYKEDYQNIEFFVRMVLILKIIVSVPKMETCELEKYQVTSLHWAVNRQILLFNLLGALVPLPLPNIQCTYKCEDGNSYAQTRNFYHMWSPWGQALYLDFIPPGTYLLAQYLIHSMSSINVYWVSSPRNLFVFICLSLNSQKLKSSYKTEKKMFLFT